MEAKNTVMSEEQMFEVAKQSWRTKASLADLIAVEQAEISFKAGRESMLKEVVETTVYLALANGRVSIKEILELHSEGKAKLKEWGL